MSVMSDSGRMAARFCAGLALLLFMCAAPLAAPCPPGADPDDLVAPGPEGTCFTFRPVSVGTGTTPYIMRKFDMGNVDEGYKGYPTAVAISGQFMTAKSDGMRDMHYYLGRHEVTEAQYYAVMGLPKGADRALLKSKLPVRDVPFVDVQLFLDKLNRWIYANAIDSLPKKGSLPAFVRLPTEMEWEFAARGGNAARNELFTDLHPYEDDLVEYEWFAGPSSSHGKAREVGRLRPNPLGLHDMLGNVSEMVTTPYYMEYYQGAAGGVTVRGGHYLTAEDDVRVSLRVEQPLYALEEGKGMRPNRSRTTGFRLALGASVLSDRQTMNEYENAWAEYRASIGGSTPAGLSIAPVGEQIDASMEEAMAALQRAREYARKAGVAENVLKEMDKEIAGVKVAVENSGLKRKEAEEQSAGYLVRLAVHCSHSLSRNLATRSILENALDTGAITPDREPQVRARIADISANIKNYITLYHDALKLLTDSSEKSVSGIMARHKLALEELNPAQIWSLDLMARHYADYRKTKRADSARWLEDMAAMPGA